MSRHVLLWGLEASLPMAGVAGCAGHLGVRWCRGGGAARLIENWLTPCTNWDEGVAEAMLSGGVAGGTTAGLFHAIRHLLAPAIRTGNTTVYRYVEDGKTRYIAITDDFQRRAGEHPRRGWQIQPIPGLEQLARSDARAAEQVLIERYGLPNLYNEINSIAVTNPIYSDAIKRGNEMLARVIIR